MTVKQGRLATLASVLGAWWLVAMLAIDGSVHPMADVLWLAGAWTVVAAYWLIIAHFMGGDYD